MTKLISKIISIPSAIKYSLDMDSLNKFVLSGNFVDAENIIRKYDKNIIKKSIRNFSNYTETKIVNDVDFKLYYDFVEFLINNLRRGSITKRDLSILYRYFLIKYNMEYDGISRYISSNDYLSGNYTKYINERFNIS